MERREALTARAAQREFGVSRDRIAEAIHAGELPASRLGVKRFLILRRDLEAWLAGFRVQPSHAESVVAARLEREGRATG